MDDATEPVGGGLPPFLSDPLGVARRRWRWIAAVLVLGTLPSIALVAFWPLRYEATAKLLISGQRIREDFVRSTVVEGVTEQLNALIGEVLSRDSLLDLVQDLDLGTHYGSDVPLSDVVEVVEEAITLEAETPPGFRVRNPGSYVFAIGFESNDPALSANVANELIDRFGEVSLARRTRQTRLAGEFLQREMERAEAALREHTAKITEFKESHRGELPGELNTKLARLERLQAQRDSLARQISEAEGRLLMIRAQEGVTNSPQELLRELRAKLRREQAVNTPEHPNVLSLERQVKALETELAGGASSGPVLHDPKALVVERELSGLRGQLAAVGIEIERVDDQVAATPSRQEDLDALVQEAEILRENYAEALRKVKEAELSESLERAQQGIQVSILETAVPPSGPRTPRWMVALGCVVGLLATAALGALALELLDPVLLGGSQVDRILGLPPLGELPRIT